MSTGEQEQPRWELRRLLMATLAGALVLGLFLFSYRYLDGVARARPGPALPILLEELTAAFGSVPPFFFFLWLVPRYPLTRRTWHARLPSYFALAVALSVLHTLWMLVSRTLLFPLAGLPPYDYGRLGARILMELPHQLVGMGTVIGFVHFADYYRATRERELLAARLETRLARAELTALQSQLHPHFLFNTLNAISSLMYQDAAAADKMMTGLSDLLRTTLGQHEPEISLGDELRWLERYIEIMRIRFRDRLTVKYDVPADTTLLLVPSLVLQPLIENCVKHGLAEQPGPATITVAARRENGELQLTVSDDGPGLRGDRRPGVGLANTSARLAHLYGAAGSLAIGNGASGGCVATLRLPARVGPS